MDICNKCFFTIGIPTYNAQKTIEATIKSALEQQTSYKYEIVIIDDGSTDFTSDICNTFSEENKNIRYKKTKNQGPLLARREIFRMSQGDYLLFLDSDDLLKNDTLQICGDILQHTPVDLLLFNYSYNEDFSKPQNNSNLKYRLYENDDF